MANKFKLWCENLSETNVKNYTDFEENEQRKNGFLPGTLASSSLVNSALRQSNLIACALMNILAPDNNNLDLRSSVTDTQTVVESGLKAVKVNNSTSSDNVTTKINGHNISSIFESNGTTAKHATIADDVNNAKVLRQTEVNNYLNFFQVINNSSHQVFKIDVTTETSKNLPCHELHLSASGITVSTTQNEVVPLIAKCYCNDARNNVFYRIENFDSADSEGTGFSCTQFTFNNSSVERDYLSIQWIDNYLRIRQGHDTVDPNNIIDNQKMIDHAYIDYFS